MASATIVGFEDEDARGTADHRDDDDGNDDDGALLNSLRYYSDMRSATNTTTVFRNGNLDLMIPENATDVIPVVHLYTILPFTTGDYVPNKGTFEEAASVMLAVEHMNTGNGVIVPELRDVFGNRKGGGGERDGDGDEQQHAGCPIKFTVEFADTEYSGGKALNQIVQVLGRPHPLQVPSAIIGPYRSAISMPTSIVTGISGYPQISPGSTSADLDDKSQYPLFGRTVPSDQGNTVPIILYLYEVLHCRHLAVINVNDAYGNAYVEGMRLAAEEFATDMVITQIPLDEGDKAIRASVQTLKNTGFRFVFGVLFTRETHDALLLEAYKQGVAGTGVHNWFFGDSFLGVLNDRTVPVDSPLRKVYQGVGLLEVTGGVAGIPSYDNYADEMRKLVQNAADLETMGSLFPEHPGQPAYDTAGSPPYVHQSSFLNPIGSGFPPFAYEAAVALGLAACQIYKGPHEDFLGPDHYEAFKQTTFTGVGGQVRFDNATGSRVPDSALHKVANWIEAPADDERGSDGGSDRPKVIRFVPVVTDIFVDGAWVEQETYIFNDGTANLPADLPPKSVTTATLWGLAIGIPILFCAAGYMLMQMYYENKRKTGDSVWHVAKHELKFAEPPEIIGRGTFGLVLLAEYRGTNVAVKRVIPPKSEKSKDGRLDPSQPPLPDSSQGGSSDGENDTSGDPINRSTRNFALESSTRGFRSSGRNVVGSGIGMESSGASSAHAVGLQSGGVLSIYKTLFSAGSGAGLGSWAGVSLRKQLGLFSNNKKKRNKNPSDPSSNWRRMKKEFVEEMRHLSKLRHPCVTTIMGAVLGKDPMLVMEYMEHGSLYDILHNETLVIEAELLLPILRDISQGMRFLHSATPQVIHGDLKAANILVDSKFRAKVADFGLSQKHNIGGTGTPFWMAPELLRHESANTAATDAYSFGIILYEVYSRRDPYEDEDALEVIRLIANKKVQKRPPYPKYMPTKIKNLMADCLEEEPEKRPTFEELDTRVKRIDTDAAALDPAARPKASAATVSLFDIFPRHIAEALRDGRPVEAEHKECVTIFFSDIVGFTEMSSELSPQKVASLLDRLYTKFDKLSVAHDVFKVETVGDAYMAVSNLVKDQSNDHCRRIAEFAMDCIQAANETYVDIENSDSAETIGIRVGFHSGPVVADVVGTRNPRYCLFGDTVNIASRMESHSELNRIHCSKAAGKILKKQFPSIILRSRGKVHIKGKGEMHTFWVGGGGAARSSSLNMLDLCTIQESAIVESTEVAPNKKRELMGCADELTASHSEISLEFISDSDKQQMDIEANLEAPPASARSVRLAGGKMPTVTEVLCEFMLSERVDVDVADEKKTGDVESPPPRSKRNIPIRHDTPAPLRRFLTRAKSCPVLEAAAPATQEVLPAVIEAAPLSARAVAQSTTKPLDSVLMKNDAEEDAEEMERKLAKRLGYPESFKSVDKSTGEETLHLKI